MTFGKLTQQDIDAIDGQSERLVGKLIEQYGWNPEVAGSRVESFRACLSQKSKASEKPPSTGGIT